MDRSTFIQNCLKINIQSKVELLLRSFFLLGILFYKKFISPLLPPVCIYEPSCSAYASLAVRKFGAFKGMALTIKRILKCNSFFPGGKDELPIEK